MILEPFKPPTLDPDDKFLLTLMAAGFIVMLSVVVSHAPTQPPVETLDQLSTIGKYMLLATSIILIDHCEPPGADD